MSRFVRNPDFISEIGAQVRPALHAAGEVVADRAEALSHHTMPRKGQRRIEVSETVEGVRVSNTNFGGHLEEWGSRNNPPYSPLRRGARAAGVKLHES